MAAKAKWLKRVVVSMAALVLLFVTAIVTILNSETGMRWIIDQVDRQIPGEIRIDTFAGTLWTGLTIPLATYRDTDREVTASDLAIDIDWSQLSTARLTLLNVSSGTVVYRDLATATPQRKPLRLAMKPIPMVFGVASLRVSEFQYVSASSSSDWRDIVIADFWLRGNRISALSASASVDAGSLHLGAVSMQLDGDVPVSASTAWRASENRWSVSGNLRGTLAMLEFDQEMLGPFPAAASGTIQLLRRVEPLVDATIQWPDWGTGAVQPKSGRIQVEGYPRAYETSFALQVADQEEHSVWLKGTASGDTNGLSALNMTVDSAIGQLHTEGSLRWLPSLTSVLRINGRGLDLSQIVAVPQTDIGIDFTMEMGSPSDFLFTVHSIDGTYNEERFRARGKLARADQAWRCSECEINIGANRASIQGSVTDTDLALTASVAAPRLDQLWPGLSGVITLDGALRGTLTAPVFTGQASGDSLSWSGWQVARFSISSRASTLQQLDLNALIEDLRQNDRSIGSFDIALKGALAELDSRVLWELAEFSANATGTLDLSSDYAQGSVRSAQFNNVKTGSWQLMNSVQFSSSQDVVDVTAHSWRNGDAEFTVTELRIAGDETRIGAKLDRLPLEMLQPAMPANFEISGYANSEIHLRLTGGEWYGSVNWNQQQTQLRITQLDEQPLDIVIPVAQVDLRLLGTSAEATAAVEIDPGLTANLQISLATLTANPEIDAILKIDGKDWYWIPAVFPEIDKFEGAIDAEMFARGPLREPNLSGELRWRDGQLMIPALNVPINDIDITVSGSSSGNADIKGQLRVGGGMLTVDGRFDELMQNSRSFTVRVNGENAEILNWPDYKLYASPDIRVAGSLAGVSVNGRIDIPNAEIAIRQIPEGSVKPSADITVIGRADQTEKEIPVTGQADFVLGKNVHVQALGLDTKLEGQLNISVPDKRQIRADGKLTLVDGVFEAYGQRLTITVGSMLFSGPLDNPFVSVRAIRKIETIDGTVTAGIDLRGPAQNLVASVFSEPTMAESDALSYLVLGRPLEQSTATEGSQLSGAAVALGLRQAAKITNQIGQAFGLDELEVAGDGGSTTALVAGKQVSSHLYVRYAYGVFSQLGSILLRYRLSRHLTLETSTGESQSMDILYLVEKP